MKSRTAFKLLLLGALLSVLLTCRPPVRGSGWNLLLVTLETTRADHLGTYGYYRNTSPNLDRLAKEGALFERFFSVSPRTNPSLASLMTSLYPHEHGVRNLLLPLKKEHRTLAEILQDNGYITGAVQTHPRLIAASGFAQGFDKYYDKFSKHGLAHQACDLAGKWIRKTSRSKRPWFMWVHLMDPHWQYEPPRPWRTLYGYDDPRPWQLYSELDQKQKKMGPIIFQNQMPENEINSFINLYDAEIRYMDEAIGKLIDLLDQLSLSSNTIIAVTADHGESLGEHNYFFEHGDFGNNTEIHVPLIIVAKNLIPARVRIPWSAQNLDIAPSLLDLIEISPGSQFRGTSLMPLLEENQKENRLCFGETGKTFHEENTRKEVAGIAGKWRWIIEGDYKLFHIPRSKGPPEKRLYKLSSDPGETMDIKDQYPNLVDRLGQELDIWIDEDKGIEGEYHNISKEALEELRSLGYID